MCTFSSIICNSKEAHEITIFQWVTKYGFWRSEESRKTQHITFLSCELNVVLLSCGLNIDYARN